MEKITLNVTGMTCEGCVKGIKSALESYDGVKSSDADLDTGTVLIEFDPGVIQPSAVEQAIVDAGFDITA
ncbi:MAG: heavy-metal-associated domain-containing protein [Gammaproteobacteria bacterium]|nr:heavy-metal-associated domain-containing protein [Gammaproteobacteria bacterium]